MRYPTLLGGGCGGDVGPRVAPLVAKDPPAGLSDRSSPARGDDHRSGDQADEPDYQRPSARSSGYLEREAEAEEPARLQERAAAARDGVPYTFDSGAVYTGEWSGGLRHGQGQQVWPDGATYEGQWRGDSANGNGRFVHKNGDQFIGQWRDNVASGLGTYYRKAPKLKVMILGVKGLSHPAPYCVCEVPDRPHSGFRTEVLPPAAGACAGGFEGAVAYAIGDALSFAVRGGGLPRSAGEEEGALLARARLAAGVFHPRGFDGEVPLRTAKRGAKGAAGAGAGAYLRVRVAAVHGAYRGEWADDRQHGFGVETWSEDWGEEASFAGQFEGGQKHGWGTYRWADGSSYEGCWARNFIEGEGVYLATDGRCFKGQWRGSLIHGLGQYLWPGGRWYGGRYVLDQKHGFGTFRWPDGRKYEGFWAHGRQDGPGRLTTRDGGTRLSLWEGGRRAGDLAEEEESR